MAAMLMGTSFWPTAVVTTGTGPPSPPRPPRPPRPPPRPPPPPDVAAEVPPEQAAQATIARTLTPAAHRRLARCPRKSVNRRTSPRNVLRATVTGIYGRQTECGRRVRNLCDI